MATKANVWDVTQGEDPHKIAEFVKRDYIIDTHPKYKVGQWIEFYAGYNCDIRMKSKITGFDREEKIYLVWDCYWSPIGDDEKRKIKLIETPKN